MKSDTQTRNGRLQRTNVLTRWLIKKILRDPLAPRFSICHPLQPKRTTRLERAGDWKQMERWRIDLETIEDRPGRHH